MYLSIKRECRKLDCRKKLDNQLRNQYSKCRWGLLLGSRQFSHLTTTVQLSQLRKTLEPSGRRNETELLLLIAKLPGLEAAKNAVQAQIDEIHRRISELKLKESSLETRTTPVLADAKEGLGIDSIGRIIRRRKLSLEAIEKKREVIKKARAVREEQIKRLREARFSPASDTA
jgi:hypothetical protein